MRIDFFLNEEQRQVLQPLVDRAVKEAHEGRRGVIYAQIWIEDDECAHNAMCGYVGHDNAQKIIQCLEDEIERVEKP